MSLLEGLFVWIVGGGDKQVVDLKQILKSVSYCTVFVSTRGGASLNLKECTHLILAVGEADLGFVLDNVLDLVELAHPVQDVVGASQLAPLANWIALVGGRASLVVETANKKAFQPLEFH